MRTGTLYCPIAYSSDNTETHFRITVTKDHDVATTIQDVAAHAAVSPATVSRVLNNHRHVSARVKQQVWASIEELNYHPNAMARGLSRMRAHTVGFVTPDISNPVYPLIARSLADAFRADGYAVLIYNTDDDAATFRTVLSAVRERRLDGLVVVQHLSVANKDIRAARREGIPIVGLGPESGRPPVLDVVQGDVEHGAYAAMEHLLELGHRRIAYVGAPPAGTVPGLVTGYEQILGGYRRALAEAGLPADESLIIPGDTRQQAGEDAVERVLALPDPPTAILACNDMVAAGVLLGLRRRGVSVPAEMSVVGVDGMPLGEMFYPALTTVAQPLRELGTQAAQVLLDCLENPAEHVPTIRFLACTLIVRDSTGPAPRRLGQTP